jgi:hypothetical protein
LDSPFYFEETTYWSEGDERAHFEWLARIGCVQDVVGRGDRLYLVIDGNAVTTKDKLELVAIYRRYAGDLAQLAPIEATD